MDRRHLKLDDPFFQGRLWHKHGAPAYVRRPVQPYSQRLHDISAPKVKTRPQLVHPARTRLVVPAAKLHPRIKSEVLLRSAVVPPQQLSQELIVQSKNYGLKILYAMAAVVFTVGLGVSLLGLRTNQKAQAQVNKIASKSLGGDSEPPPSAVKPSDAAIRSYTVSPDIPRYIDITSLKVHARVYPVGTTKKGALAAPSNIYNVAWYKNSAKPGQAGAMLMDGHSGLNADGVFNGLVRLKSGDFISITRGDGQVFTYKVVKTQLYSASGVDMASLLVSADTSKPGLNLISCAGDPIPGTYDLNKRLAVFAVQQ